MLLSITQRPTIGPGEIYDGLDFLAKAVVFIAYTQLTNVKYARSCGEPLALSEALPLLEDMGVDVYTEHPYELKLRSGDAFWIQDFHLRHESGTELDVEAIARRFEDCFMAVLRGDAENDGLNRLVLHSGLD